MQRSTTLAATLELRSLIDYLVEDSVPHPGPITHQSSNAIKLQLPLLIMQYHLRKVLS